MKIIISRSTGKINTSPYPPVLSLLLLLGQVACSSSENTALPTFDDQELTKGKASPILIGEESTVVVLEDYVLSLSGIDSVSVDSGLQHQLKGGKLILNGQMSDHLGNISLWSKGQHYDILLKKAAKKTVELLYDKVA